MFILNSRKGTVGAETRLSWHCQDDGPRSKGTGAIDPAARELGTEHIEELDDVTTLSPPQRRIIRKISINLN